ncbi:MAG: class I SAM-dependent methyltransferase [Magnetovibrio sp.]|nr:class I SAM-dependent methyltransferase [Magnetovibrio sp.]
MMRRDCCLCGALVEDFESKPWKIPNLGVQTISYGLCPSCGMVLETDTLSVEDMNTYYRFNATYINPGRGGKPSAAKVRVLTRLGNLVQDVFGQMPKSVFQVGCSDGYTLSRFKEFGAEIVSGMDLSEASCELAQRQYGVDVSVGDFESFDPDGQRYDLFVLTHILEHLYDPAAVLQKCSEMQDDEGRLLVEVPLLENVDCFSPGSLTLEHLNYFTERTMRQLLARSGYDVKGVFKDFTLSVYPVITLFCQKGDVRYDTEFSPSVEVQKFVSDYMEREKIVWGRSNQKIKAAVPKGARAYIYGAGVHTTQLLANTEIEKYLDIVNILDSSPTKWGCHLGEHECKGPDDVDHDNVDVVVISSFNSENEIAKAITGQYGNAKILKLYDEPM